MRFVPLLILSLALASPGKGQAAPAASATAEAGAGQAVPPPQTIELKSPDREIETRLQGLFAEMEGLGEVETEVRSGVVTLRGIALTAADRQKAEAVASRLAGVVSVENEIEIEQRIAPRLQPLVGKMREIWRETIAFLPLLLIALIIFLAVWLLGRLVTRQGGIIRRIAPNPLVQTLVAQIVRLIFIIVGLVLAMRIMGATALLGSVLGAAGVVGLAVGFAVRDTIENYIASVLLSIRRPFAPNDHVIIEGLEGRVTRLNSRATFLTSLDGSEIRIPNAQVYKARITNFTQIPERRFEFVIGIGHENDLCGALATALAAVKSSRGVLSNPEPQVEIDAIDSASVAIKVLGWVDLRSSDFGKVRSEAIRAVKQGFDREGISMPAPVQNVRMLGDEQTTTRRARAATPEETEAVSNTRPDRTIEEKVNAIRRSGEDDLLTIEAPKE